MSEAKDNKMVSFDKMPDSKKLSWRDGHTNLLDWQEDIVTYARMKFDEAVVQAVIVNKIIPTEWLSDWERPANLPADAFEMQLLMKEREDHNRTKKDWDRTKGAITSFIVLSLTESSLIRIDKYNEKEMKAAIKDCDAIQIMNLIDSTHTFSGAVSSFDDQEKVLAEWINFAIKDKNEKLESYANRYYKQVEKCEKMGLPTRNKKKRVYRFLKGLREYSRSALVQLNVLSYLANVNTPEFAKYQLEAIVEELLTYDQTENPVGFQQSATNKFAVHSTESDSAADKGKKRKERGDKPSTPSEGKKFTFPNGDEGKEFPDGTYQVMAVAGLSKKFKKDSAQAKELFKKPSPRSDRSPKKETTHNEEVKPKTKALARRLKEENPDKIWADIYKMITCRGCGLTGHVKAECKRSNNDSPKAIHNTKAEEVERPRSQTEMRNLSGFFSAYMTNHMSRPIDPDLEYVEAFEREMRAEYVNIDNHANIHVWVSSKYLTNVRQVNPINVKGFGGFTKTLSVVGDHPLLGEVFVDEENGYNILSTDLLRKNTGYLRRTSDDNMREFLYNKELRSVISFDRDPVDGFYKVSIAKLNAEIKRAFPNMCRESS